MVYWWKIANNNAINDNLEQQAKLLYNYWFIQFNFPDENGIHIIHQEDN